MEVLERANFRVKLAGEDLVVAVVQDYRTGEMLMVAFMNREALERTLSTGTMTYFSTSRGKLWTKGETSGHTQKVREVRLDCDGDALLFKVDQEGAACHKGYTTCFFREVKGGDLKTVEERVFDPEEVYKK